MANSNIISSIALSQKVNIRTIDSDFCLITRQVKPRIAIQACHILRLRTPEAQVNEYKVMWNLHEFNIDSTENLVSLRADWHASYDANCWAFVPSTEVLEKIEKYGERGTYKTPYKGYQQFAEINYNFVAFPSLGLDFIARDNDDNTNNYIFPYEEDFPNFPILKHHSHPYLVIANALPKFHEHRLTEVQVQTYATLLRIVKVWKKRLNSALPRLPIHKRRMGDPDEGPSDEEDGGSQRKTKGKGKEKGKSSQAKPSKKPTAQAPIAGNAQRRKRKHDMVKTLCRPSYPSPPGTTLSFKDKNDVGSCFGKKRSIVAWIAGIAAASPPEPVREDVIAQNGEIGRAPFTGDWHKWCYPWTQPPEHSKYSSNDWAMQMCMCKLTAEPCCWACTSDEDDSDISDGEPCMTFSS